MMARATRVARWWLYVGHRWIGIATCLMCAMWFVSGLVMMYVPYPRLAESARLAMLPDIDATQIAVSPTEAMRAAKLARFPGQMRFAMLADEPVYRIVDGAQRYTVSARDGRVIGRVDAAMAAKIVAGSAESPRSLPPPARGKAGVGVDEPLDTPPCPSPCRGGDAAVDTLVRDQWTVAQGFDPHRPLHKISLGDAAGTEFYVSSRTGETVQSTTRRERLWNWLGSVPHWIYPTVLRQDGAAWRQVVMWTSGPATIGAIAGVWIGILRLRPRRRYRGDRVTTYAGWMKWHHVAGLIAGAFVVTWLASGWLSVDPFRWFDRTPMPAAAMRAYAGHADPMFPADIEVLQRLSATPSREVAFAWLGGRPLIVATDADRTRRVVDGRTGEAVALSEAEIARAARMLVPDAPLVALERLSEEDAYWYSHHVERRLPVLRAMFGDPARTWFHIDPATGEILGRIDARGRAYRWLFNAFHDFDLRVLLRHHPAWDIVVWLLSLGGLIVSVSGVVVAWRRLGRKLA